MVVQFSTLHIFLYIVKKKRSVSAPRVRFGQTPLRWRNVGRLAAEQGEKSDALGLCYCDGDAEDGKCDEERGWVEEAMIVEKFHDSSP